MCYQYNNLQFSALSIKVEVAPNHDIVQGQYPLTTVTEGLNVVHRALDSVLPAMLKFIPNNWIIYPSIMIISTLVVIVLYIYMA